MNTIPDQTLKLFSEQLLVVGGVVEEEAEVVAEVLVWSNLAGRKAHGVSRIPAYLKRVRNGLISSPCCPTFDDRQPSIVLLDGGHGMGQYVGRMGMIKSIELAATHGVGIVGGHSSNHYGAGAYYSNLASRENMLGFAFSNSAVRVAPYGGVSPVLGTNPFSFGAPMRDGRSVLVDFSTGSLAGSAIRDAIDAKTSLPLDVVVDKSGRPVTDPSEAVHSAILPFDGPKGFGIGIMIEILSGIITGAAFSHQIASLYNNFDDRADIGHFFLALDISKFLPIQMYFDRMDELIGYIKKSRRMPGVEEIMIPGEARWRSFEQQEKTGIRLDAATRDKLSELALDLGVPTPW